MKKALLKLLWIYLADDACNCIVNGDPLLEIAVLSKGDSGYTKEINLISWNGREPKYDIRSFSPNREKCGKGITLNADEAAALLEALQKEVNSGD